MQGSVLWQAEDSSAWLDMSRLALLWKLGLKNDMMTEMPSCLGLLPIDLLFRERWAVQAGALGLIPGFKSSFIFYHRYDLV